MSETISLYDLVLAALKSPLPEPWSLKDRSDSSDDVGQHTNILLDHPDYTAVVHCYRSWRFPTDWEADVTCFRKDRRNPTREELINALSPLFTPVLAVYRDWDDWSTIEQAPEDPLGFGIWDRAPDDPGADPDAHYGLTLNICPQQDLDDFLSLQHSDPEHAAG